MPRSGNALVSRWLAIRECVEDSKSNTCEKPATGTPALVGIVVGLGYVLFFVDPLSPLPCTDVPSPLLYYF